MTALLTLIALAFVLVAFALTVRHHSDRVIGEVLASEQRQIERERVQRQAAANLAAKWVG